MQKKYLLYFSGWFSRPICIQLSLIVQARSVRSRTATIYSGRHLWQMWRIQMCQRERLAMLPRSWSQIQVLFGIWERSVRSSSNFLTLYKHDKVEVLGSKLLHCELVIDCFHFVSTRSERGHLLHRIPWLSYNQSLISNYYSATKVPQCWKFHQKSIILQHCERSELRLQFGWKYQKWSI